MCRHAQRASPDQRPASEGVAIRTSSHRFVTRAAKGGEPGSSAPVADTAAVDSLMLDATLSKLKTAAALQHKLDPRGPAREPHRLPAACLLPGTSIVVAVQKPTSAHPMRREASSLCAEIGAEIPMKGAAAVLQELQCDRTGALGAPVLPQARSLAVSRSAASVGYSAAAGSRSVGSSPLLGHEQLKANALDQVLGANARLQQAPRLSSAVGLRIHHVQRGDRAATGGGQLPASTPSNRSEAIRLGALLDSLLQVNAGGWEHQCLVHDEAFSEVILQVLNHCAERGAVLQRIRRFYLTCIRRERESREAARQAREQAQEARASEEAATVAMQDLEQVRQSMQEKLDSLRSGMVRLKLLRVIHGRKLLTSESRNKELERETAALRSRLAEVDPEAAMDPSVDGASSPASGRPASLLPGSFKSGRRMGVSSSGVDVLAAQMEALRDALAEKDSELEQMRSSNMEMQMQIKASDQEVNTLMASITATASSTRSQANSRSIYPQHTAGQTEEKELNHMRRSRSSAQSGSFQSPGGRQEHALSDAQRGQTVALNEADALRKEVLRLKASLRWSRAALAGKNGGGSGGAAYFGGVSSPGVSSPGVSSPGVGTRGGGCAMNGDHEMSTSSTGRSPPNGHGGKRQNTDAASKHSSNRKQEAEGRGEDYRGNSGEGTEGSTTAGRQDKTQGSGGNEKDGGSSGGGWRGGGGGGGAATAAGNDNHDSLERSTEDHDDSPSRRARRSKGGGHHGHGGDGGAEASTGPGSGPGGGQGGSGGNSQALLHNYECDEGGGQDGKPWGHARGNGGKAAVDDAAEEDHHTRNATGGRRRRSTQSGLTGDADRNEDGDGEGNDHGGHEHGHVSHSVHGATHIDGFEFGGVEHGNYKRNRVPRKRMITSLKHGKTQPRWMCHKVVGALMQARVEYEHEMQGRAGSLVAQDFGEFVEDRFVEMHGAGKQTKENLRDFITTLKGDSPKHARLKLFRELTGLVPHDDQNDISVTDRAAAFYRLAVQLLVDTACKDHLSGMKGVAFWTHYSRSDVIKFSLPYYEKVTERINAQAKQVHAEAESSKPTPDHGSLAKREKEALRALKSFEATLKDNVEGRLPSDGDQPNEDGSQPKVHEYGEASKAPRHACTRNLAVSAKFQTRICVDTFLRRALEHYTSFEVLEEMQLVQAFGSWDLNGNGNLELEEFTEMIKHANPDASQRKITRAFVAASGGQGECVDRDHLASALLANGLTLSGRPTDAAPSDSAVAMGVSGGKKVTTAMTGAMAQIGKLSRVISAMGADGKSREGLQEDDVLRLAADKV